MIKSQISVFLIALCLTYSNAASCNGTQSIGCVSCQNNTDLCQQCAANYFLNTSTCILCGEGQYSSGGNVTSCMQCSKGCSNCNNNITCASCQINYGYSNGSCTQCPIGTSSQGQTSSCFNCSIGCSECQIMNGTSIVSCTNCSLNYGYIQSTNGSICTPCEPGYVSPGAKYSCVKCPPSCSLCQFTSQKIETCTSCQVNYINPAEQCVKCPSGSTSPGGQSTICTCQISNCATCNANQCTGCNTGYVINGGYCSPFCNISNCITCSNYNQCMTCSNSLVPSSDSLSCLSCNISNCLSCQVSNICAICQIGYILTDLPQPTCLNCSNITNCLSCSSNSYCYKCANGYMASNGICTLCLPPCSLCNLNGSCSSCLFPFNPIPNANGNCFICNVPNCNSCDTINQNICSSCNQYYVLNNATNTCILNCSANCQNCTSNTVCSVCAPFYFLSNGACSLCDNTPQCIMCNQIQPSQCLTCYSGFFLNNGTCFPCPSYCTCQIGNQCNALTSQYSLGYVLVSVNFTNNTLGICDPGCSSCQSINPSFCFQCFPGFYLSLNFTAVTSSTCYPCTLSSNCMQCLSTTPSVCIMCFPNSVLTINNTCQYCSSNCVSCNPNNINQCTSCAVGFTLSNNSCLNSNLCGIYCSSCINSISGLVCGFCVEGSIQINGNCVPCQAGCGVCSTTNISVCLNCLQGFYSNSTGGCSSCPNNCLSCQQYGCISCLQGYSLNNFTCIIQCQFPCATCTQTNSSICFSCIYNMVLINNNQCTYRKVPQDCQQNNNCTYCPLGNILDVYTSLIYITQFCTTCIGQCSRCQQNDAFSLCVGCYPGYYLYNFTCLSCNNGCLTCINGNNCSTCSAGFIPYATASLSISQPQSVNCLPCLFPCITCLGSTITCLSCATNYTLQGTQCVTSFNFQVICTLNAEPIMFNQNYYLFLNTVANSVNESLNSVIVLSVNYVNSASVTTVMLINSQNKPNSSQAIAQQKSIKGCLTGSVGGMTIVSAQITTNGGINSDDSDNNNGSSDNGLSTIEIILISVSVLIVLIIGLIIYCCWRKKNKQNNTQEYIILAQIFK